MTSALIESTLDKARNIVIDGEEAMAQRVVLDAMIPREDFSVIQQEFELGLFSDMPLSNLMTDSPILKLLRKPDFQRETNHWTPEQISTFIASFLDNEVIPSLILWKSPRFIFVIDGGHRLSALRAWVEDDYGDGAVSSAFYRGGISNEQRRVAKRARQIIEGEVGSYADLAAAIDAKRTIGETIARRANRAITRSLDLQWIQGNADVAETSFFKINSQGTPLDSVEEMLIKNRRKPISIAARAIVRSGTGHKYWSAFSARQIRKIEALATEAYGLIFEPEASFPLKTLDVSLGGSSSPVDALSLLTELLGIAGRSAGEDVSLEKSPVDTNGDGTIRIFTRSLDVLQRITGNSPGSLGLHPAVYFYTERGKYSRFLFLGMTTLIADRLRNNDATFFKKFTETRIHLETFLIKNKSVITLLLQNMSKKQRVPQINRLFAFLIEASVKRNAPPSLDEAIANLGLIGRILDVTKNHAPPHFTDDIKSMLFIQQALKAALKCPICGGYLNTSKSVSYDHIRRKRDGGDGRLGNGQLVHPYCNSSVKG